MARSTFGGTTDDSVEAIKTIAGQRVSSPQAGVLVTFWSAKTGGTQYTDLQLNGVATSTISSDENGQLPEFSGPDGVASMWADAGAGRVRINTNSGPTDAGVAGFFTTPGSATVSAASTTFRPRGGRYKKWTDLPEPFIIPHRGAGPAVAPDNAMESYRIGHSMDLGVVDGGDIRVLGDGTMANMHDRDMRFTPLNGTGTNVDDLTGPGWHTVVLDAGRWFGGQWGNLKSSVGPQIWDEFGNVTLLSPEWKTDGGDALGYQKMVDYLVRAGLGDRVLFNSFSLPACQYALANGITNACWNLPTPTNTTANLASLSGTGVQYVGMSSVPADAVITAYINAGYKTIVGPVSRQTATTGGGATKTHLDSIGVSGYYLDDPLYEAGLVAKYRRTTAPWTKSGNYYHGHKGSDANRGKFVGSAGFWRWQANAERFWLQGWACPIANAASSYTLTVPIVIDAIGSNTTRHADIIFGALRDEWVDLNVNTAYTGYEAILRANGQINLYKYASGSLSQIGTVTSTAIQQLTLSAGLTAGVAITSLPVNALTAATKAGAQWSLPNGQIVTASADAASGATSVSINSITPLAAVASSTLLPQQATLKIDVSPTQIVVTRTDVPTSNTFTVADTTYRGEYVYLGSFGNADGFLPSFGTVTVT